MNELGGIWIFPRKASVAPTRSRTGRLLGFFANRRKRSFSTETKQEDNFTRRLMPRLQACPFQRKKQTYCFLSETRYRYLSKKKPDAVFVNERRLCSRMTLARPLPSPGFYTFSPQKAALAALCQGRLLIAAGVNANCRGRHDDHRGH